MDKEMALLLPLIADASTATVNGTDFHTGRMGRHQVVACKCGIGKVNAAMSAQLFIDRYHPWCNRAIADLNLAPDELIAMIMRGEESLIPDGKTRILEGDRVVTYRE